MTIFFSPESSTACKNRVESAASYPNDETLTPFVGNQVIARFPFQESTEA